MSQPPIYLDYAATTPVDELVLQAMLPYFRQHPGNAASRTHYYGWEAEDAVKQARKQVAQLINADPKEIVFTSGATEAINLAIKGIWENYHQVKGQHIVTITTEHKAVLDSCAALARRGAEVTYLPVNENGAFEMTVLADALRNDTLMVVAMWANNETGVLHPITEIGRLCAERGVFFCCDATQAVGKVPVDVQAAGIHLLAGSGHKFYGPKGIGALYVRRQRPPVEVAAQIHGGGHERKRRSGTLNVPAIVGMGAAAKLALAQLAQEQQRIVSLRDSFEHQLLTVIPDVIINGGSVARLPNISNVCLPGSDAEQILLAVNSELAIASGSACTSASLEPSHVLKAMGRSNDEAYAALRISFGRWSTKTDVERAVFVLAQAYQEQHENKSDSGFL